MSIFSKIFGDINERTVIKLQPAVGRINDFEKDFEGFSGAQLKEKTAEFNQRLKKGETLDDILPQAFALVREAAKRTLGQRHFDMQLIGGMVLHEGKIAEMKTGEGKTLAATLAIYLNALEGRGVHVVTVNDYLSKRDTNWMGPIYYLLGLSVGCIVHDKAYIYEPQAAPDKNEATVEMQNLKEVPRQGAYAADITYGTNNEFGFDYLRDNMVADLKEMVQREHHYAIIDEVDSILIDEARTPLIISAPDAESTKLYETFSKIVPRLKDKEDFSIDEKMRAATLTEEGIAKVEKILGMDIYNEGGIRYVHHLEQALRARALFNRDQHYVVKDGEVIIVDDFTGRLMFGRRYSEGLHQAIEAKEGVRVQQESRTLATITFQNYFRMYKKLAGMTGTALTNAEEFSKVYKLEVVAIPTNKPMIRADMPDRIYRTENGKFQAVVREVKERHEKGQPVLVGTVSIEKNELLSAYLKKEGIAHQVLNAKNHEQEAQIIAEAGRKGAVTVATNMAGRGVDIVLGGKVAEKFAMIDRLAPMGAGERVNPDGDNGAGLLCLRQPADFRNDPEDDWQSEHDKVLVLGGLHIIGTERHEARRIDNQLRGRAGRQGDPGSSQFFVSLEDDLMRIFGSDRIKKMMEVLNVPEDQPIENRMLSRAIESAQGKIEGYNFDTRKHVLEYDDVMNKQRQRVYGWRRQVLGAAANVIESDPAVAGKRNNLEDDSIITGLTMRSSDTDGLVPRDEASVDLRQKILDWVGKDIHVIVEFNTAGDFSEWNFKEIFGAVSAIFVLPTDAEGKLKELKEREEVINYLTEAAKNAYELKEKEIGLESMRQIERLVTLRMTDMLWMNHLDDMDHLRDSVRLRAYGQKDPLVEYKNEGHLLFQKLLSAIESSVARTIYKVSISKEFRLENPMAQARENRLSGALSSQSGNKNIGRNDPCWCGSGKKFKKCHGK
jgi:preprotein translocase subunit SecA